MKRLGIDVRPEEYVIARVPAGTALPEPFRSGDGGHLLSVTCAADETSVICREAAWAGVDTDTEAQVERGWRWLSVRGPLEFTLTGIIAALTAELAAAGVALVTLSTFDTDHILVKAEDLDRAADALRDAGHDVYAGD